MASIPALARLDRVHTEAARDRAGLTRFSLEIAGGEVLALLGPAGAGGPAVLDLFAGFLRPVAGDIEIDGRPVARTPAHRRGIGLLPRGLGLFPFLSVAANVALPLRPLRLSRASRRQRVADMLDRAGIGALAARRPGALSAEERLRAALARALVTAPKLLLLDEPLGGFAPGERTRIGEELRGLLRREAGATLLATAEPADAMALADRVAVLGEGRIAQIGPCERVYEEPESPAVAAALGEVNLLHGKVQSVEAEIATVRLDQGGAAVEGLAAGALRAGAPCLIAIRPERLALAQADAAMLGEGALPARVDSVIHRGDHARILLTLTGGNGTGGIRARRPAGAALAGLRPGAALAVAWQTSHARVFPLAAGTGLG